MPCRLCCVCGFPSVANLVQATPETSSQGAFCDFCCCLLFDFHMDDGSLFEKLMVLGWLLKDAGWSIWLPELALPAAALALSMEAVVLYRQFQRMSPIALAHEIGFTMWLVGNIAWALSDFLYDPVDTSGSVFPWHTQPLVKSSDSDAAKLVVVSRVILALGMIEVCVAYFLAFAGVLGSARGVNKDASSEGVVFSLLTKTTYQECYIGFWLAFDFSWTFASFAWSIFFAVVTIVIIVDNLRRFRDPLQLAVLFWVLGNIVWVTEETLLDDAVRSVRVIACVIILCGVVVLVPTFAKHATHKTRNIGESTPLAGGEKLSSSFARA